MSKISTLDPEIVVNYLGPNASFSHQAALDVFRPLPHAHLRAQPTFSDIFDAVQRDIGDDGESNSEVYGVVPFENSSNGSVVQLLELLADHDAKYPDVTVCGEYYLPVHHCLLVKGDPLPNGPREGSEKKNLDHPAGYGILNHISQLYTHPQVWGQCTKFLAEHMKDVERIDVGSTSLAAQKITQDHGAQGAAIASKLAARVNGLVVVAEDIEDQGDNTTRFFIICDSTRRNSHLELLRGEEGTRDRRALSKWKSLISFTIDHESPGSLADALAVFKNFDFNLTSIYTRPSREQPWHYIFFVECAETCTADDTRNQKAMIEELGRHTQRLRHLGRWEDQLKC